MTPTAQQPEFTIGIEEEYLLVDPDSGDLRAMPQPMLSDLHDALGKQVSREFLNRQIEVGTEVCATVEDARADLGHLRRTVQRIAGQYGLAPIAASCHPWEDWADQDRTDKPRYAKLDDDLGAVARRMLIGGMHVHVGIADPDTRIAVMNRLTPWLPVLLALSASSPFWQGRDTGLASWRLSVFDGMPRTGLPPRFPDWDAFETATGTFVDLGVMEDTSKIWWDLRPSHAFPTLEVRICDVSPKLEDTLTLAALVQGLARTIWRGLAEDVPLPDPLIVKENRWRAQRYGVAEGLIVGHPAAIVPTADIVDDMLKSMAADTAALDSSRTAARARDIVAQGSSAIRQRSVRQTEVARGASEIEALRSVVQSLIAEFSTTA
ncbi:carboxylate-amine ligase [Loktanella sp. DJP18]|uniref:carboxylate-amine ligase n=1 Tax=Loktanella sp. DJP18 TaxID=3409788 RepID=UPI003BB5185F